MLIRTGFWGILDSTITRDQDQGDTLGNYSATTLRVLPPGLWFTVQGRASKTSELSSGPML